MLSLSPIFNGLDYREYVEMNGESTTLVRVRDETKRRSYVVAA
jgi:hypothetical protein